MTPGQLAKVLGADTQIVEVMAASKTRAFVLDGGGRVRFVDGGAEDEPPVAITMPGVKLEVAAPMVHRTLSKEEAAHARASLNAIATAARDEGPIVERAMFWKGSGYHDLARRGRVVVWRFGMNNAFNEKRRVCVGRTEADAVAFMAVLCGKPPKGFKATSAFYVPNKGAVVRSYANGSKRELRGLVDAEWRGFGGNVLKAFSSAAAAEKAYEKWEHKATLDGWQQIGIEIDKRSRSSSDGLG